MKAAVFLFSAVLLAGAARVPVGATHVRDTQVFPPVQQLNLYRIDLDATGRARGPLRVLRRAAASPIVSPDGQRVAFVDTSGGRNATVTQTVGANGESLQQAVGPPMGAAAMIGWRSPQVVLALGEKMPEMRALDVKTGAQTSVPMESDQLVPPPLGVYSPLRDEWVYLVGPNKPGGQILARNLATGLVRKIAADDYLWSVAVSSDGRTVAYSRRTAAGTAPCEIRIVGRAEPLLTTKPVCGEEKELLLYGLSPSGRLLVFHDFSEDVKLRMMNVETRQSWPLSDAPGQPVWGITDGDGFGGTASFAPDGAFVVVFGRDQSKLSGTVSR
jgi:hypothetical protein